MLAQAPDLQELVQDKASSILRPRNLSHQRPYRRLEPDTCHTRYPLVRTTITTRITRAEQAQVTEITTAIQDSMGAMRRSLLQALRGT
jgi:hypothetical protein